MTADQLKDIITMQIGAEGKTGVRSDLDLWPASGSCVPGQVIISLTFGLFF